MKFTNWASKYTFVIFFCGVLSINQGDDNFMKDYDNALESNVDTNNVRYQPQMESDQKSEKILQDTITSSKKRGNKIIELKQDKGNTTDIWKSGRIANHPACQKDFPLLAQICRLPIEELQNNDFVALTCAQNRPLPKYADAVSETCEAAMWKFKFDLTRDVEHGMANRIQKRCHRDEAKLKPCQKYLSSSPNNGKLSEALHLSNTRLNSIGGGHYISCVFDVAFGLDNDISNEDDNSRSPQPTPLTLECSQFLSDIESIVFSDYRLIGDFAEKCKADIEGSNCGRVSQQIHSDSSDILVQHSQGTVIECLSEHLDNLKEECRHETLRVVELQSQDYHLDRSLYFACKSDREHFCAKEIAGDGRIYTCLLKNKMKPKMSQSCKKQLRRRQKVIAEDYKADYGLTKACRIPIKKYKCRKQADIDLEEIGEMDSNEVKKTRLSSILLCLEDAAREDNDALPPKCISEIESHRRQLMNDFQISPELVVMCAKDIQGNGECKDKGDGGRTIHCLMNLAYQGKLASGDECEEELKLLLKESNPLDSGDWRLDPVLQRACQDVVDQTCDPQGYVDDGTQSAVMGCLMHQLSIPNNKYMNKECRGALMEIQYFISRDFSLTPKLYKACKEDARTICSSQSNWQIESKHPKSTYQASTYVFPCLVRHLYKLDMEDKQEEESYGYGRVNNVLSDKCQLQLQKTLEERSASVRLHPRLADNCRQFLADYCIELSGPGEEMQCLEDNIDELSQSEHKSCYQSVVEELRIQAKNPVLNPLLVTACGTVMKKHCPKEAVQREGSLLKCLITFKEEYSDPMNDEINACFGAIEHWQILSLKDIRFSFNFKQACREDILTHCNNHRKKSKLKVVSCLSEIIVSDAMNKAASLSNGVEMSSSGPSISPHCQKEVKFQLLQKHSSIKLNPLVKKACEDELKAHCPKSSKSEKRYTNALECLKSLDHSKVGLSCRKALLVEEKEEAVMNSVDFAMMKVCKHEIKNYNCAFQGKGKINGIFRCLKDHRHEPTFDKMCLKILDERIRERSHDYRLNPSFQAACARNIQYNCSDILNNGHNRNAEADFLEGQVISCLQQVYLKNEEDLYPECKRELTSIIQRSALDYKASPSVLRKCKYSIEMCKRQTGDFDGSMDDFEDGGVIEECLRMMFKSNQLAQKDNECSKVIAQRIQISEVDMMIDPILQDACSLDLVKFCRNVPARDGKRLQCLFYILRDEERIDEGDSKRNSKSINDNQSGIDTLGKECVKVLKQRSEMFKLSVRQVPISADAIRDVNDLYNQISSSPHRNYLLIVACSFLFVIFVGGLLCGRVSKRARIEYVQKIR